MALRLRTVVLVGLAIVVLGAGALVLATTVLRGRTPAIRGDRAVAELTEIELGGTPQSVLIRGRDRSNPVLLFLHGGPGMPAMYLAHAFQRPLERDFVVVQWDRRGAGKSYEAGLEGPPPTVSGTLDDTIELTRRLRERFGRKRVFLVGHSWGSYLGLLAVRDHPELFAAFVGTGQLAGTRAEARALRRRLVGEVAQEEDEDELLEKLATGAELSEDDVFRARGELYAADSFLPLLLTGFEAPEYTLGDVLNVKRGAELVDREMVYDVRPKPLEGEIEAVDVPVFFFLGRHDANTPSALAARYLDRLHAPLKGVVWFERSAHFPFFEQPARFADEMARVKVEVETYWAGGRGGQSGASEPR